MKYVSLHHHTTFSYRDGYGNPEEHVARAAELEMGALAHTEHGNVSSHVRLEKAGLKYGVKPLFGCELYTASGVTQRKWHLTVLAETQDGYQNLNRIVSAAWSDNFYYWPTVTGEMLAEYNDGLIVLSGCADSLLACTLLGGKGVPLHDPDMKAARRVVEKFKSIFGDRYYLECQQFPELGRARDLAICYQELSEQTGVPLIASSDVHYPRADDNEIQKILHAAGRGGGSVSATEAAWEYDIRLTLPTSDRMIIDRLRETGLTKRNAEAALRATGEVAERCNVVLPKSGRLRFPCPDGMGSKDLIWAWLRDGWKYRWESNPSLRSRKKEYAERLNYEMGLIEFKDYIDYFLMLSDVVRAAKDASIPVGPARGSAAASLTCYLLRITEVDPMQYPNMVFERFIDATREDVPDVDLDFADDERDKIREHLIMRYGADRVGNIGNFVRYRGKNSINDVARVYGVPSFEAATVNGFVIERSGGDSRQSDSLEDTKAMFPQVQDVFDRYPKLNYAMALEGNLRGMSVHAAGLVVANTPLTDTCATYTRESGKDKRRVTVLAYDKKDAEYLGMLKIDALSLTTMGMISIAIKMIGMSLEELYKVPMDDPEVLAAFKRNDVIGIFQFEGRATRIVCGKVKPDNFIELADINALSRPGPLFSGTTANYINVKFGKEQPLKLHPIVDRVSKQSKYQIIYQEQVLTIIRELGGFPVSKVADIRKIISQKLGEASFNTMFQDFLDGALRLHNVKPALATRIWKFLVTSATYSFNIAHCVSYSMLAFWCMWLKVNYPVEFYTASLTKMGNSKDEMVKVARLLRDAGRHGVVARGPDLIRSASTWAADPVTKEIIAGFEQVPGIGEAIAAQIIATRQGRGEADPFTGWGDLLSVPGIGPAKMKLISDMADQDDPFNLELIGRRLTEVKGAIADGSLPGVATPTHRGDEIPSEASNLSVVWIGAIKSRDYKDWIEDERARTGDSNEDIMKRMKDPHLVTSCLLRGYDDSEEDVYLRFNRWKFPRFKQVIEDVRLDRDILVARGRKLRGFGITIQVDHLTVIDPEED